MLHQGCFICSEKSYNILAKRIDENPEIVFLTQKLNKNLRSSVKTFEQITYKLSEIYQEIKGEPIDTIIRETEFRCCRTLSEKKIKFMRGVNLNVYALEHIIENKEIFLKSEILKKDLLEYMNLFSDNHDQKYGRYCSNWKGIETYKRIIYADI